LNLDDARCAALAEELIAAGRRVIGFTTRGARQPRGATLLSAENLDCTLAGISFTLRLERSEKRMGAPDADNARLRVESPLTGAHNAENLLAAIGLLAGTGTPLQLVARLASEARGAPGRLERIADPMKRVVLVDYAHSDDALARVLDALVFAAGKGPRVICVFGCGGDRDRGKRPLMGKAAASRAQIVIATSDNPRSEDPLAILSEIEPGLIAGGLSKLNAMQVRGGIHGYAMVPDRRAAIRLAIASARPGDAVLIAGKGHEPYQIVGTEKRPFDDRREAAEAIAHINAGGAP
jgi:UDP-N-acetylmuramoyl-L-alanyl-D-glutamate--2,6-diaminopimelate ligase